MMGCREFTSKRSSSCLLCCAVGTTALVGRLITPGAEFLTDSGGAEVSDSFLSSVVKTQPSFKSLNDLRAVDGPETGYQNGAKE
jgi:hypothetical protein